MIPSVVASEVAGALRDFLATGFGPSSPALAGVVNDFLAEPGNLAKGPYLSIALPFQPAPEGGGSFPQIPLGFTPYRHQRLATSSGPGSEAAVGAGRSAVRPGADRGVDTGAAGIAGRPTAGTGAAAAAGRPTTGAAGPGSGKTECFLFPILDYCRAQSPAPGIKAVLIYPMNALASDQARHIARTIDRSPTLRGKVTAGLFVGRDNRPQRSPHTTMGRDHVITDRDTLRDRPPDVLLTNYKMLDYLLVRPFDFRLWRHNGPDILRYLVVDELHAFDGAQGTDLACLVRRLRVRLRVSPGKLTCVGTSATLGGAGHARGGGDARRPDGASGAGGVGGADSANGAGAADGAGDEAELLEYVFRIFGQRFEPDAVVGETRQSIDAFLGDAVISRYLHPRDDLAARVDPARYATAEQYLRAQHELFFDTPIEGAFGAAQWRLALADRLREHAAFVNLLRVLPGAGRRPEADVRDRRAPAPQPPGGERSRGARGAERALRPRLRRPPPGGRRRDRRHRSRRRVRCGRRSGRRCRDRCRHGCRSRSRGSAGPDAALSPRRDAPLGARAAPHGVQPARGAGQREGRLRPAGPRRAPVALGRPGRAGLRLGHRAHAGTDARRRGGRGPGRAGTGLPRGPPPHPRGVRGAVRPGAGAGARARARHPATQRIAGPSAAISRARGLRAAESAGGSTGTARTRTSAGAPRGPCSLPTCPARPAAAEGATAWSHARGLRRHGESVGGGLGAGLRPSRSGDDEEGDNGKMEHRRLRRTRSHTPGSWLSAPIPRGVRRGGAPSASDRASGLAP